MRIWPPPPLLLSTRYPCPFVNRVERTYVICEGTQFTCSARTLRLITADPLLSSSICLIKHSITSLNLATVFSPFVKTVCFFMSNLQYSSILLTLTFFDLLLLYSS